MVLRMQQATVPALLRLLALAAAGAGTAGATAALGGTGVQLLSEELVPPSVSEFAQRIDDRLQRDSTVVGQIARHLHGVENTTLGVAEDVLNKVYDMHSVEGFVNEHEAALREHDHLSQEVARLTSMVDSMAKELDAVRNQTQQQDAAHRLRQQTVMAKEAKAAALRSSIERRRLLTDASAALERSNELLHEQNIEAMVAVDTISKDIDSLKANLSMQENVTRDLEAAVLQQHRYAEECNLQAGRYESQLGVYEKALAVLRGREGRVKRVAETTTKVHEILMQKNAVLKARIQKAHANTATVQTQTFQTRALQEQYQNESQAEMAKLGRLLGEHLAKEEAAKAELKVLEVSVVAEQRRLEVATANVDRLQTTLLSGEIATMRSNNTQLKAELHQAQDTLLTSQANLMRFRADMEQANLTLQSLQNATQDSLQQARAVAAETLQQVVSAKQKDEEAAAQAKEAAMRAEAAALMDCNATWDERHQSILEEIERCAPMELDLKGIRAQNEALTNTISASTAGEAVEG